MINISFRYKKVCNKIRKFMEISLKMMRKPGFNSLLKIIKKKLI